MALALLSFDRITNEVNLFTYLFLFLFFSSTSIVIIMHILNFREYPSKYLQDILTSLIFFYELGRS